jgi:type IV secretory pathway VirB3-like protein
VLEELFIIDSRATCATDINIHQRLMFHLICVITTLVCHKNQFQDPSFFFLMMNDNDRAGLSEEAELFANDTYLSISCTNFALVDDE